MMCRFKKLCFFIFAALMINAMSVKGQDYVFKVLAGSGENKVLENNSWKSIKIGSKLTSEHTLKVGENTYLGLVHNGGSTMAINEPGTYKVKELAKEFSASKKSVAGKYAEFVINKMTSSGSDQNTNATGAVERSEAKQKLELLLPQSVNLYSEKAILRWIKLYTERDYRITIKNMFDEVIHSEEVKDNQYELDFSSPKIAKMDPLIVQVESLGDKKLKSNEYIIKRVGDQVATSIEKELASLKSEFSNSESSALDQMILASFFEDKDLLLDALTRYEKAVSLAPDTKAFTTAYKQFIRRNNLGENEFYSLGFQE